MKIRGSIKTEANFNLVDGVLTIKQPGTSVELTPEQARALMDYIKECIDYEEKHWSVVEGK